MAWPVVECEWCAAQERMVYRDGQWRFPDPYAGRSDWRVVEPSPGYTGAPRIADSQTCEDAIRDGATAEADDDADSTAQLKMPLVRLALSDDEDRWQRTGG